MSRVLFLLLFTNSFFYCQNFKQLKDFSRFYNREIDSFSRFINAEPSVDYHNNGLRQMVYEMDGYNIGVEEHRHKNGLIGQIYIFQTESKNGHAIWKQIHHQISKDKTFQFVKAMFGHRFFRKNELTLHEFQRLLENADLSHTELQYAVRYKNEHAFCTLSVIENNMIISIDDKNF